MRTMTRTAYNELPETHKETIEGQTWAIWCDHDLQTNFTPVQVVDEIPRRPCVACGQEQAGKKVWSKAGRKVICMACGSTGYAAFNIHNNVVLHPEYK